MGQRIEIWRGLLLSTCHPLTKGLEHLLIAPPYILGSAEWVMRPIMMSVPWRQLWCRYDDQALTSTRGYSLPDFFNYYPYPTRKFLLPDRVEGSEEHPLCPIIDKSKEWKCNTFVMMDIFIIPRNKNFTLQQYQSPFIFKSIIKFKQKNPSQILII